MSHIEHGARETRRPTRAPRALALLVVLAVATWPGPAIAQKVDLSLTTVGGSGLSATSGEAGTATRRSPLFLEFEVGAGFEPDPRWEWTAGLIAEVEGRTSLGLVPKVKRLSGRSRFSGYAAAGVPAIFSPFTLLGFEVGGGLITRIAGGAGLVLELRADFFFAGTDLPDSGMLSKFDAALGIRVPL